MSDKLLLHATRCAQAEEVPGFAPSAYTSETLWATSRDGAAVPISVAYRTALFKADGSNACVLSGWVRRQPRRASTSIVSGTGLWSGGGSGLCKGGCKWSRPMLGHGRKSLLVRGTPGHDACQAGVHATGHGW